MSFEIFLSHADRDKLAADTFKEWLETNFAAKVFVSSIRLGDDFFYSIHQALRDCKLAIILATPSSLSRHWVMYEAGVVDGLGKTAIPVCVGGVEKSGLPSTLAHRQACDYNNDVDFAKLVDAIASHLNTEFGRHRKTRSEVNRRPRLDSILLPSVAPYPAAVFEKRTHDRVKGIVQRIIESARVSGKWVCFSGIAHSDLFGTYPYHNTTLRNALNDGVSVKLIFLDPDSSAAARRAGHEGERLMTQRAIRDCIAQARKLQEKYNQNVDIRLAADVSNYLCFNETDMVIQPYFTSTTGHESLSLWVTEPSQAFKDGKSHFDRLWGGDRCVLFDLGNVIVNFDHRVISRSLLKLLPAELATPQLEHEIDNFIFGSNGVGTNNALVDRGVQDLAWLRDAVCSHFEIDISLMDFTAAWCDMFNNEPNDDVLEYMTELQQRGLRVAICSNTNHNHWDKVNSMFPKLRDFCANSPSFLSFQLGSVKTDPEFFDCVARKTGLPSEHHILIDDRYDNCRSAEAAGMYALLFEPSSRRAAIES